MENTYDYLFHYNPYTGKWNAFKREHYNDYFNGKDVESLIENKDIDKIITTIKKSK
jgi:hypothetical protein